MPLNHTASKANSGTVTLQNSPRNRKHTQESKAVETQADDFDDASELLGVNMNPVVMN